MRVLLVEDDSDLAKGLSQSLQRADFTTLCVGTGQEALLSAKFDNVDLIILDLGLPDMDGLLVLKQLKREYPQKPVLILTARDQLDDKVKGLEQGADDYLVKPFELAELIARLRVLERRLTGNIDPIIKAGNVELDPHSHLVRLNGEEVDITRKEYLLLRALMQANGKVVTKDALEAKLYNLDDEVASNALEVHISHLRRKLGKELITTIRGVGYSIKR